MNVFFIRIKTFLLLFLLSCFISVYQCLSQDPLSFRVQDIKISHSNFKRIKSAPGTFAQWLRDLPTKPPGSPVLNYRGLVYKRGDDTTVAAVIDWDIHGKRMEQCMDILIRLYAEFLWSDNRREELIFPLPGGYHLKWVEWLGGMRPYFKGINVTMKKTARVDSSRTSFESYLSVIFAESHTQQFYHGYRSIDPKNLQIGDFVVKKGTKSHAVMIVDLVRDDSGEMMALIGHGDTPACQFYLLNYRNNDPWFPINLGEAKLPLPIKRIMTWDGLRRFSESNYRLDLSK
jgi:hypothetical protein